MYIILKKYNNSNFRTLIYVLFYTGLRPSDILTFTKQRVDLENRVINYYSPKRKKYREIAFHEDLLPVIEKRINEIEGDDIFDYKNVENVARAVNGFMQALELDKKGYTPRTFRKTFTF